MGAGGETGTAKETAMKTKRAALAAMVTLATLTGAAQAQDWPTRPITLIVPFSAGGGVDASARLQALVMGEILGQTIVVENVGAAAGTVGTSRVAKATPDGYTMLIGNSGTQVYSQWLYKKRPYDSVADFEPVGIVTESPRVLVARKGLPVNNLQEFIAYAKANPGKINFGSAGLATITQLYGEMFNIEAGVKMVHVPYKGSAPATQDLLSGQIQVQFDPTTLPHIAAGRLKCFAILGEKRWPGKPAIPTLK
jgi:tripartite-type tricarboxylate transporter receptor subunit TctC